MGGVVAGIKHLDEAARGFFICVGVRECFFWWSRRYTPIQTDLNYQRATYMSLLQRRYRDGHWLGRLIVPFIMMIALLVLWDGLRPDTSLFTLASVNNNPERLLVRVDELLPRFEIWLGYIGWVLGPAWITLPLLGVGLVGVVISRHKVVWLMGGYVLVYLVGHWLVAFNTYDRYLLPIVPLAIVLVAGELSQILKTRLQWVVLVILLLGTGIQASRGQIDLGRDGVPRQNTMIELTAYLNDKPLGAIIYDHWLGWELGYYLGEWTDKRRTYYPTAEILAEDAVLNPDPAPRYFVVPVAIETTEVGGWLQALRQAGFGVSLDFTTEDYRVYEVIPP